MKKKLILIFSLIILSVCIFALSSSASEYDFVSNGELNFITNDSLSNIYPDSAIYLYDGKEYNFNFFHYSYDEDIYFIQPYSFKILVNQITNSDGNCTFETFSNACYSLCTDNGGTYGCMFYNDWADESYGSLNEEFFNKLYYYSEIDETDLTDKFNEGVAKGKIDGVAEFKESDEYKGQYTTGYTDGIKNFKETELPEMLALEKQIGQAEGKNIYLASEEYRNVLQGEYDNGYNAAVNENDKTQIKNSLGVIIGSCGLVIIFLLAFYFITSKKKYKRR